MSAKAIEYNFSLKKDVELDSIPGTGTLAERLVARYGVTIVDVKHTGRRMRISATQEQVNKMCVELGDKCRIYEVGFGNLHTVISPMVS